MDLKKIVEKALKKEDYSADIKDFTPEQKNELTIEIGKAAKIESDAELGKIEARRAELKRLGEQGGKSEDDAKIFSTFKTEQENTAKSEFFSNPDYPLTNEEKSAFDGLYKKLYSGEVSKEGITAVLKKAYGALKPDELISARKRVLEGQEGAKRFNAGGAGPGGNGPTITEMEKYTPEVQQLFKSWQSSGYSGSTYTLDRAKRVIEGGMGRNL